MGDVKSLVFSYKGIKKLYEKITLYGKVDLMTYFFASETIIDYLPTVYTY